MRSAIYCGHANENPSYCDCDSDCYCQSHTCKERVQGPNSLHGGQSRQKTKVAETPLLNLYAQVFNHDEAWVVGNRKGLTALRDALSAALEGPSPIRANRAFTSDGEGYVILTVLCESEESLQNTRLPYTDMDVKAPGEHPMGLIGVDAYRNLVRATLKAPLE